MKFFFKLAAALTVVACLTGCIQSDTVVSVNADGSGEIQMKIMMSAQMLAMAKQQGGENAEDPFSDENVKKIGDSLGEVEYKSHEKVTEGGYTGVKVVYTFKDVNKVKFQPGAGMGDQDEDVKPEQGFQFSFAKNDANSTLTVIMPTSPKEEAAEGEEEAEEEEEAPAEPTAEDLQMLTMMKAQMAGMRVSYSIKVNGEVVKTNASLPVADAKGHYDLLLMDIDKLDVKSLYAMQQDDGKNMFGQDKPGLRSEPEGKKIEISFK